MQGLVSDASTCAVANGRLRRAQAEFYTWAIYGYGISKCAGTCGPTIGGKKANLTTPVYVRPRILALTLTLAP